jgi:hypothetical protein
MKKDQLIAFVKTCKKSPVKPVKSPVKSPVKPVKSVKSPVKPVKSPVKPVKSPVKPVKSPVKSLSPSKINLVQLKLKAKKLGCKGYSNMKKDQLVAFVRTCKKSPVKSPIKSPIKSLSPSKITLVQLKLKAKKLGCKGYSNMKKDQLVAFVKTCKKSPLK